MAHSPLRIGVLYDFPSADGGAVMEQALRMGLDEVRADGRLDREIELVTEQVAGLPWGSEHDVLRGFRALDEAGCLLVIGPAISDNALDHDARRRRDRARDHQLHGRRAHTRPVRVPLPGGFARGGARRARRAAAAARLDAPRGRARPLPHRQALRRVLRRRGRDARPRDHRAPRDLAARRRRRRAAGAAA